MRAPVLFLIFNRPEPTSRVFQAIREARPSKLYVAADGARANKVGEQERCAQARGIIEGVDWPCEVKTLFRRENIGCKSAVTGAIHWLFQNEPEGIIIEDDCLPAPDFFRFCDVALESYRPEPKVMHVGGHVLMERPGDEDMFFSRLVPIWGWATWRRAWSTFDINMTRIGELRSLPLSDWYGRQARNVKRAIETIHFNNVDAWGARWVLSVMVNRGLSVLPKKNLISNVGFGADATHTRLKSHLTGLPLSSLSSELSRKVELESDPAYDEMYLKILNRKSNLGGRLIYKLQQLLFKDRT